MKESAILLCDDVTVDFDGFKAVQGMNLKLEKGELRFLIGPNGAGKTTMLGCHLRKSKADGGARHVRRKGGYYEEEGASNRRAWHWPQVSSSFDIPVHDGG